MMTNLPLNLFYVYSHKDDELRGELLKHLGTLRQQRQITEWHFRKIAGGQDWKDEIDEHLSTSKIILLLVSPDFIDSDYCYNIEMKQALKQHEEGKSRVIPVILRPVDWYSAPFAKLQALPKDAKAVTSWANRDEAFLDIATGIRQVCDELQMKAGTYTNTAVGFTAQYPKEWQPVAKLTGKAVFQAVSPDQVPVITINVWDAASVTTFTDALKADMVAAGGSGVKIGPETAITLPDGTAATMAKATWSITGYPAETLGYGMKKGDKYITANVTTVALLVPYDEAAFSEILNTITFTK